MNNKIKLYEVFAHALGVEISQIDDNLEYNSISEWDSVSHMAVVVGLEETFRIVLDTDDIISMNTISKAKEILLKHGINV